MKKDYYFIIIPIIIFLIIYIPYVTQYNINKEDVFTSYQDEIDLLDINGDGYLTFDEAKAYGNTTPESKLLEFFNQSDKNKNNLLKGAEFDTFRYLVKNYQEQLLNENNKENSSSKTISNDNSNYNTYGSQDHEEYDKVVGYDEYGNEIWVSYYYTSGNGNMEPGVYRYVGNEYTGYDIEYVSSDWQHEYQGNW